MAYVPGFKNDIFISYSWLDDRTPPDADKGWVTRFHEALEFTLKQRLGRGVSIWRDARPDREPDDLLFETRESVERSAAFIALVSPAYLAHRGRLHELAVFYQKAKADRYGVTADGRSRVFDVLLRNVQRQELLPELADMTGFQFNDARDGEDAGTPLEPRGAVFNQQLRLLTEEVTATLLAMKAHAEEATAEPKPRVVFVADCAGELNEVRSRVVSELLREGVKVADRVLPPYDESEHDAAATRAMLGADLCVHLLGATPGLEMANSSGRSYERRQLELGLKYARGQLVWADESLDLESVENKEQRELLLSLEGLVRDGRFQFARTSPAKLLQVIIGELERVARRASSRLAPPADSTPPSRVFISYRRGHGTVYAWSLYQEMAKRFGDRRVFMDINVIEPGVDFKRIIMRELDACAVMVVLINRGWSVKDGRRPQGEEDFVRVEVSTALRRRIRVVPLLLEGARMPRAQELPEDLSVLADLNAFETTDRSWPQDVQRLTGFLETHLAR